MQMGPAGPVPVPAGRTVAFEPGGRHVMLMDLRQDLETGVPVTLTLRFEQAGPVTVVATVQVARG